MKKKHEAIVIGGGAIGGACAYYLSRRGVRVLVLESRHLCAGASGSTAAIISSAGKIPTADPLQRLNFESHRLLTDIEKDFDRPIEKISGGSLHAATNEQEAMELQLYYEQMGGAESDCRFFRGPETGRFEPLLGPRVLAAVHEPATFHVNPFRLCEGYMAAAIRRGGSVEYGVTVQDVKVKNGKIDRVVTDRGDYYADWVIAAAGAWTPQLFQSLDIAIPITPARGQVILTEAYPMMTERIIFFFDHLYIKQTASGNFYLGSHTEYVGFDNRITLDKITAYTRLFSAPVPLFNRLRAIRFFTGFRPISEDSLPVIGPVPGCSQLIVASGHGRNGMCLSAGTGKAVSELVADGETALPTDAFSIDRFAGGR